MTDSNKPIHLAAPLPSVRRHGGDATEPTATGLPAYEADATSVPLGGGHTGAVPFGWEHRHGHPIPKSVRTRRPPAAPPSTIVVEPSRVTQQKPTAAIVASNSECAREEERRFSDALSRDDVSCVTVNCSATGLSDAASECAAAARSVPASARGGGGVMMDRFLPAAHAVAAGSPQNTFRKAASARDITRSPAVPSAVQRRLPVQHIAACNLPPPLPLERRNNEDDDDDGAESDAHSTAGFASKRCGLLPDRCVKSTLLLSCGGRRGAGRPFMLRGGGSRRAMDNPLLRRSRNGQQHTGDDPGMQSWEEVYIKSLLRSGSGGGVMGPAAAVASELDRTVRELYKRRGGGHAVQPKASHLGLLLVLDRSNEDCGRGYYHGSSARRISKPGDAAATKTSPDGGKKPGLGVTGDDAGKYGFPLLLEDSDAVAGREMALSPQPLLLPLPLPKSPTESWLSRALPSVSTRRPPATSFLGLHVQPKKQAPLPWGSLGYGQDVDHDRQRQRRVHDLQK